tara:strand:+ start:209 stop:343 length:135 start_codon:yes stop_codon:yes gene_type:complete
MHLPYIFNFIPNEILNLIPLLAIGIGAIVYFWEFHKEQKQAKNI